VELKAFSSPLLMVMIHGSPNRYNIGIPLRSTLDGKQTQQYCNLLSMLTRKARNLVRDVDPLNDLVFVRIRTMNGEVLISVGGEYILVVIQESTLTEP
jgi:dynein light chain roadblock-type